MTAETCPACKTPNPIPLGDFYHCDACGLVWYIEPEDLDVTEAKPE